MRLLLTAIQITLECTSRKLSADEVVPILAVLNRISNMLTWNKCRQEVAEFECESAIASRRWDSISLLSNPAKILVRPDQMKSRSH